MNLYKKLLDDEGKTGKDILNRPLMDYFVDEKDEALQDFISSGIISFNLLSTGRVNRSIKRGGQITISSPSKFGKSLLCLAHCKAAQKKQMMVVVINTEGPGAFSFELAKAFGIDTSPEKFLLFEECSIEEVRNIIGKLFDGLTKKERQNIFLVIDSWGALGSTNVVDKAVKGSTTRDMQEPQLKNQLAILLNSLKLTRLLVAHCYSNTGGFGEPNKISGASKAYYLSDSVILFETRSKDKNSQEEVTGYIIHGKCHKSRYSIEESKLDILIEKNGGLNPYYGLLDDALEGGFVLKEKGKIYRAHIKNDELFKESKIYNKEFWTPIFKETDFQAYLEKKYQHENNMTILENDIDDVVKTENNLEKKEEVENISEDTEDTDEKTTRGRPRKKARLEVK